MPNFGTCAEEQGDGGPKQREVLCRYYLREQDIPTIAQEMRLTPARIRQILAACTKEK